MYGSKSSQYPGPPDSPELGLNVSKFYGKSAPCVKPKSDSLGNKSIVGSIKSLPRRLNNLFGPTQIWNIFNKQNDALEFSKKNRNGLMAFAFQQSDGVRLFLVAHPKVFWHYNTQKTPSERCTYEIIPELSVCKLYFDLEFDVEFNPDKCGSTLVKTFIAVLTYFLSVYFEVVVSKDQVLDLDSSTSKKFSRHLIFQSRTFVFRDNKSIGSFVSHVCRKLQLYLQSKEPSYCQQGLSYLDQNHPSTHKRCLCCVVDSKACIGDIGISIGDLKQLFVFDRKGQTTLFCDLSVYSKNRHFRLFQNTKWGKNSPLLLSPDNSYKPNVNPECTDEYLETIFLDSLISYFEVPPDKCNSNIKVISFNNPTESSNEASNSNDVGFECKPSTSSSSIDKLIINSSPYPDVDKFINKLVSPGHIWRSTYFASSSTLVYDIVGNRYCENIRRQHKSNNVKYIVSLSSYTFYQKCHDFECSNFRSTASKLPVELVFKLDGDCSSGDCADNSISDSDLIEVASVVEDLSFSLEEFEDDF